MAFLSHLTATLLCMTELTDTERALLAIEAKSWTYAGRKESAIREATGLSRIAATQIVNRLLDTEAALAHDPLTVRRLLRIRDGRRRLRGIGRLSCRLV